MSQSHPLRVSLSTACLILYLIQISTPMKTFPWPWAGFIKNSFLREARKPRFFPEGDPSWGKSFKGMFPPKVRAQHLTSKPWLGRNSSMTEHSWKTEFTYSSGDVHQILGWTGEGRGRDEMQNTWQTVGSACLILALKSWRQEEEFKGILSCWRRTKTAKTYWPPGMAQRGCGM